MTRRPVPRLSTVQPRVAPVDRRTSATPAKTAAPFYLSAAWRGLMDHLLAVRGRKCQECARTGTRIFGHHVRELADGGAPLDPGNVRLLCGSCHSAVTAANRAARTRKDHRS